MDQKDFDAWWLKWYPQKRHPLYKIYNELWQAGADLDYLEALKRFLIMGDKIENCAKGDVRLRLKAWATRAKFEDRGKQKSVRKKSRQASMEHPVSILLMRYTSAPLFYTTGKPSDNLGSFVLLAVSEHLKDRTRKPDKRDKPRFRLANKFLRVSRGERGEADSLAMKLRSEFRRQATERVKQFKKSEPEWKLHLHLSRSLPEFFLKLKEETRAYIEQSFRLLARVARTYQDLLSEGVSADAQTRRRALQTELSRDFAVITSSMEEEIRAIEAVKALLLKRLKPMLEQRSPANESAPKPLLTHLQPPSAS